MSLPGQEKSKISLSKDHSHCPGSAHCAQGSALATGPPGSTPVATPSLSSSIPSVSPSDEPTPHVSLQTCPARISPAQEAQKQQASQPCGGPRFRTRSLLGDIISVIPWSRYLRMGKRVPDSPGHSRESPLSSPFSRVPDSFLSAPRGSCRTCLVEPEEH